MDNQFNIIGVGNPIVDAITFVGDDFLSNVLGFKGGMELTDAPTIDRLLRAIEKPPKIVPGGSAGNVMFALARMGAPTAFIGKIGNCQDGAFYKQRYTELGGDGSRFKIGEIPNGRCLSLVTPDGERTMRTDLGAAMTLTPDEILTSDFEGYRHAHIEGYLLFNETLMMKVLDSAKAAGCSISLDLASFEVVNAAKNVLHDILKNYVDIVFANEEEADQFTELGEEFKEMALELATYCDIAAVKVGARGSYVAEGSSVHHVAATPAAKLVDTTAAGDLWAAGFLYGWSQKRSLTQCAEIGSWLGSAVVQTQGSELDNETWQAIMSKIPK